MSVDLFAPGAEYYAIVKVEDNSGNTQDCSLRTGNRYADHEVAMNEILTYGEDFRRTICPDNGRFMSADYILGKYVVLENGESKHLEDSPIYMELPDDPKVVIFK